MYLSVIAPGTKETAAAATEWSSLEVSDQEWLRGFFPEGSPPPDFLYRRTDGHATPNFTSSPQGLLARRVRAGTFRRKPMRRGYRRARACISSFAQARLSSRRATASRSARTR